MFAAVVLLIAGVFAYGVVQGRRRRAAMEQAAMIAHGFERTLLKDGVPPEEARAGAVQMYRDMMRHWDQERGR
jgi:hypothetical protein